MESEDKELRNRLQEQFSEFEFPVPGDDMWPEIENKLDRKKRRGFFWFYLIGVGAVFIIGFFSGILFMEKSDNLNQVSQVEKVSANTNSENQSSMNSTTKNNSTIKSNGNTNETVISENGVANAKNNEHNNQLVLEESIPTIVSNSTSNKYVAQKAETTLSKVNSTFVINTDSSGKENNDRKTKDHDIAEQLGEKSTSFIAHNIQVQSMKNDEVDSSLNSDKEGENVVKLNENSETNPVATKLSHDLESETKTPNNLLSPETDSTTIEEVKEDTLAQPAQLFEEDEKDKKKLKRGWGLLAHIGYSNIYSTKKSFSVASADPMYGGNGLESTALYDANVTKLASSDQGTLADYSGLGNVRLHNSSYRRPFEISVLATNDLAKRISIETGLIYTRICSRSSNNRIRLNYFTLPVGASFTTINGGKFKLALNSQLRMSKLLHGRHSYQTSVYGGSQEVKLKVNTQGLNVSTSFGLDARVKLSDKVSWSTRAGVAHFIASDRQVYYRRSSQTFWPEIKTGVAYKW